MIKNQQITNAIRKDIFDILSSGIFVEDENGTNKTNITINYYGRLVELDFLKRIYDLDDIVSNDRRFTNAEEDIWKHRIMNKDWGDNWIFTDRRFELNNGEDEKLLNFLCEVFHPEVREEDKPWPMVLNKINELLKSNGYELYEKDHISGRKIFVWKKIDEIIVQTPLMALAFNSPLKNIGEGSYARVFKYFDKFYNKDFVIKRAKGDLNEKELIRFKKEYETMSVLNSPYIVNVYNYNDNKNEYIMEYMDCTLGKYISKNNDKLTFNQRKNIGIQILKAFEYISSKSLLHRDISYNNILLKKYDDGTVVVKVADFGLVKSPESDLTSCHTEIKGFFNDQALAYQGFDNYSLPHEVYALTIVLYFVLTGKTNIVNIKKQNFKEFVAKGTNPKVEERYKNIEELHEAFSLLKE